jgi:hypothetical protein
MLARRALLPLALLLAAPAARPEPGPPASGAAIREAIALLPGEATAALVTAAETVIDPDATFRVVLAGACQDARLLLLDGSGAAVPGAETREVGAATVLTLTPAAALVPAGRYQLRLDGVLGRELHVGTQVVAPARWELRVAGDPPPPPPKAAKMRKGRR